MQTCPKCGYARKPSDAAPDWQCPSCGIAYDKFGFVQAETASQPGLASRSGSFTDRFIYAILGGIVGAILGAVSWFLYGLGFSHWQHGPGDTNVLHWVYPSATFLAVYGFIFKDKVADAAGDEAEAIVRRETRDRSQPWWAALIVVAIVLGVLWYEYSK